MYPHQIEPDGLVVEDEQGNRLLAVPTSLLEILRFACTLQYTRQGVTRRFRVDGLADPTMAHLMPERPAPVPAAVALPIPQQDTPLVLVRTTVETSGRWQCQNPECRCLVDLQHNACPWCHSPRPRQL